MKAKLSIKLLSILAIIATCLSSKITVFPVKAQVGPIFVNEDVNDGLVGHWKFDETGNTTALDFAGSNHAVLQDTASLSNANLPVLVVPNAGSLALDGINDYAQINAPTAALSLSTSFSVTAWVRRSAVNQYDAIYDSGAQANKWWIFIADNGAGKVNRLGFGERGILEVYSTQSIVDTNWHHIAVVKNGDVGNNISFFVDGAASGSAAVGSVSAPGGSARMGALLDGAVAAQFGGNLDDLRVYNRALSAAEISRLSQGQGCVTDGASWATAYRELQCALAEASAGEEIWLAGGTYRPGTGRGVSFNLVNGVNVLGGFTGSETLASQRPAFDPSAVLTNLTGDILGNDTNGFINYTENSRNVVIAGPGVSATLDGLAIRQGNNDVASGTGAGLQVQSGAVGLSLNNVVISGNSAGVNGGGIHSQAPLTLSNVTLTGNRSTDGNGGGLFSSAGVTASNLQVLGNTGHQGGGIQMSAPLMITGGLFDSNRATIFFGGAINAGADLTVSGVTFNNNQAPFGGGAIESSGPTLSIMNSTFTNNLASVFTGGAVDAFGTVNIATSTFSGNRSTQNGGAIFSGSGVITVDGSTFNGNQATGGNCLPLCSSGSGGAIASLVDLIVTGSTFTNNTARLDGGAISASGPTISVTTSNLNSNQAGFPANTGNPGLGRGGAIFSTGALSLTNTHASSNGAQAGGGAIYSIGTMLLTASDFQLNTAAAGGGVFSESGGTIANSAINQNTATNLGGGLALSAGILSLNGVTMDSNMVVDAAGQGGGLHIGAGTVTVNNGAFTSNSAARGGGLYNAGTLVTQGVTFTTNTASVTGGGLYNAGTMADSTSTFDHNQAAVDGGGAAFAAGTSTSGHGSFSGTIFTNNTAIRGGGLNSINEVSLMDVTFSGNQATPPNGDGGGLFTLGGVSSLTRVTFANNTAGRFGGGARLNAGTIQRSSFSGNTAGSEGGGALLVNTSEVIASLFNGNSSSLSGGLSMQGIPALSQTLQVINSLFYDNHSSSPSGVADLRLFDLTIELVNNTFARPGLAGRRSVTFFRSNLAAENNIWNGYLASLTLGQDASGITINEDFNLFFNAPLDASVPPGAHGLTADPQFADPLGANFSLKISSLAIDAGDNGALPPAILTDLANQPRFIDTPGIPNTGVGTPPVDRGAFEFVSQRVFLPALLK